MEREVAMTDKATEKPFSHTAAEQVGAVIEWWTAPAVCAANAWGEFGLNMLRASLPKTAPSTFGKEDK